jgi:hypothetical protein
MRGWQCIVAMGLALASVCGRAVAAEPPLPDDVRAMVEAGDFQPALDRLQRFAPPDQAPFAGAIARLHFAQGASAVATTYTSAGMPARALRELADAESALGDADGMPFRVGLERLRVPVEEALAADDAREKDPLSAALAELRHGGITVGLWALYLVAALAALGLLRALARAFPRSSTAIEFEDLDADEPARAAHGRRLTFEMAARLRGSGETPRADIDPAEDFDRSGLANVTLFTRDAEPLEDLIAHGEPVKVGPFAVTPRFVYDLLALPFRRPHRRNVRGSFASREGAETLVLEVSRPGAEQAAHLFTGASREEVLGQAVDFVRYHLAGWRASDVWASYRDCREALRLLDGARGEGEKKTLLAAVARLESAVSRDPENWTAQFRLALALRKLGRNREAVEALRHLERGISPTSPAPSLAPFLERNPDFRRVVRYNLGVCLSKIDGHDERKEARGIFEAMAADASVGARLQVLATAGRCAVLAGEIEDLRASRGHPVELRAKMDDVRRGICALKDDIEKRESLLYGADPQAYLAASALALNAYGRASYLCDELDDAERALIAAANRNPRLACAHLNLAQVYLKRVKSHPEQAEEIDDRLCRALELSPDNRKAHHLMAKLYTYGGRRDFAKAEKHYLAAGRHPMTDLNYAQLLDVEGKATAALDRLASSLQRFPKPVDFRYDLLLKLAAGQPQLGAEHLRVARLAGTRALAEDISESARRRLEAHVRQIEDRAHGAAEEGVEVDA